MSNTGKFALLVIILLAVAGLAWWKLSPTPQIPPTFNSFSTYDKDVTLLNSLNLPAEQQATLKNNITLTVQGDAIIQGSLKCENGSLNLVINGNLEVDNLLQCIRPEQLDEADLGNGITIVVSGDVNFKKNASIDTNGHVQIVRNASQLVSSMTALDAMVVKPSQKLILVNGEVVGTTRDLASKEELQKLINKALAQSGQ